MHRDGRSWIRPTVSVRPPWMGSRRVRRRDQGLAGPRLGLRPAAAAGGRGDRVVAFALLALVTLPAVGIHTWFDWLSQAGRSGDPSWPYIGAPLSIFFGQPVAIVLTVLSVLAVFVVPPGRASAWIGILSLVGAPSLHMFALLFLLPAMRLVRREIGLVAAILVATYVASYLGRDRAGRLVAAAMDRWPNVARRAARILRLMTFGQSARVVPGRIVIADTYHPSWAVLTLMGDRDPGDRDPAGRRVRVPELGRHRLGRRSPRLPRRDAVVDARRRVLSSPPAARAVPTELRRRAVPADGAVCLRPVPGAPAALWWVLGVGCWRTWSGPGAPGSWPSP